MCAQASIKVAGTKWQVATRFIAVMDISVAWNLKVMWCMCVVLTIRLSRARKGSVKLKKSSNSPKGCMQKGCMQGLMNK